MSSFPSFQAIKNINPTWCFYPPPPKKKKKNIPQQQSMVNFHHFQPRRPPESLHPLPPWLKRSTSNATRSPPVTWAPPVFGSAVFLPLNGMIINKLGKRLMMEFSCDTGCIDKEMVCIFLYKNVKMNWSHTINDITSTRVCLWCKWISPSQPKVTFKHNTLNTPHVFG